MSGKERPAPRPTERNPMKILVLDTYPVRPWRISKDTSGGYGTANRFGDGFVAGMLTRMMAKEVDWPPLYCVYLLGVLREKGHDVQYSRDWRDAKGQDLCFVTSSIVAHETEVDAVQKVAELGVPVGAIGPFATSVPKPYLDAGGFVIGGEPEMFALNTEINPDRVGALSGVVASGPAQDIDSLPLPAWDIIFQAAKPRFGLLGKAEVMMPIQATRGCPYSCFEYCVYPLQQGRKVRVRDPQKIVDEMIHWQDTLGVTLFIFRDPVFSINRKHTVALCEAMEASGRELSFVIETHLNNIDDELAAKLHAVGLKMIKVGIESVNPDAIEESGRFSIKPDEQAIKISGLEKLGINVTCFYILGLPGDTEDAFFHTLKYAQRLNTLFAQISVFTPYPGTPAFGEFEDSLTTSTFENFTQYDLVFNHPSFTPKQIRALLGVAYRKYYTRPRWMFKYLTMRFASGNPS